MPIALEAGVVKITNHSSASTSQTHTLRTRHGLCSLFDIELDEDVLHVRLDRFGSDRQLARHGLIGKPFGDQPQDFVFPRRESVRTGRIR